MVEIVVHLLLINEHFFVPKLYVGGNGSNFSSTLESNIWDYVMYSRVEHLREACGILSGCCIKLTRNDLVRMRPISVARLEVLRR